MRHYTSYLIALALAVLISFSDSAAALGSFQDYDAATFDAATQSNQVVVLDYYAAWCPVCRRQHVNLRELLQSPKYAQLVAFKVNYDDETALREKYRVKDRGTLVMLRGGVEIARVQNVFKSADLESFLAKAATK
jgi:thioredoxin 1